MNANTEVTVGPMELLHIVEGRARYISMLAANPSQNLTPEMLLKEIAGLYAYAENLKELVDRVKAQQPHNGAEVN
jgi:hypothetical protein